MNALYIVCMPIVIVVLLILTVELIIKLFKEEKPPRKKKTISINEARDRLWKAYTNAYFDFD